MQFVRQSKFRHVFAKPMKREFCLEDVRVTKVSWDSLFCAVNTKFIAVITEGSGGPFIVVPLSKTGRIDKDYPKVDGHRAPCLDIAWCPFNENVIASCSEDCTAKVWHIPDKGLMRNLKEPVVELLGHQKRVGIILWHPTADNVLLTAGADLKIFLWNVASGEALIEIAGHPDIIYSIDFNHNGSKIVTTCKDKQIRIIDPRTGRILQQGAGHEGVKAQRAIFLKDGRVFTTGFTKRSERMYALRDEEALDEPIVQEELETSNAVLFPLYDPDTGLLFLCGKGDSNVRYYEVNNESPFVHFINVFATTEPQRGIGFMPKRGVSANENEIDRIYKTTNRGIIEVLQFFVPRKSEQFQYDLYPDTKGTVPAITAEDWLGGKNADPILVPIQADKNNVTDSRFKSAGVPKRTSVLAQASAMSPLNKTVVNVPSVYPRKPFSDLNSSSQDDRPEYSPVPDRNNEPKPTSNALKSRFSEPSEPHPVRLANSRQSAPPRALSELMVETMEPVRHREFGNYGRSPPSSYGMQRTPQEPLMVPEPLLMQRPPSGQRSRTTGFKPQTPFKEDYSPPKFVTSPRYSLESKTNTDSPFSEGNLAEMANDIQKLKFLVRRHEKRIRQLEEELYEKELDELNSL